MTTTTTAAAVTTTTTTTTRARVSTAVAVDAVPTRAADAKVTDDAG